MLRKKESTYSSDYLYWVLRSLVVAEQLENLMVGTTFRRIDVEQIRGLAVPMPPERAQAEIADYIEKNVLTFNSLIQEAQKATMLLPERRTALISVAVTGQIDVRRAASASALAEGWNTVQATVGSFADEHSTL